jgi:histidine ammonia-lyase
VSAIGLGPDLTAVVVYQAICLRLLTSGISGIRVAWIFRLISLCCSLSF